MSPKAGIHLGNITLLASDKHEMDLDCHTVVSDREQIEKVIGRVKGAISCSEQKALGNFLYGVGIIPFFVALVQIFETIYDRLNQKGILRIALEIKHFISFLLHCFSFK